MKQIIAEGISINPQQNSSGYTFKTQRSADRLEEIRRYIEESGAANQSQISEAIGATHTTVCKYLAQMRQADIVHVSVGRTFSDGAMYAIGPKPAPIVVIPVAIKPRWKPEKRRDWLVAALYGKTGKATA